MTREQKELKKKLLDVLPEMTVVKTEKGRIVGDALAESTLPTECDMASWRRFSLYVPGRGFWSGRTISDSDTRAFTKHPTKRWTTIDSLLADVDYQRKLARLSPLPAQALIVQLSFETPPRVYALDAYIDWRRTVEGQIL